MKKVLIVSLLLVSIFLIGNAEAALAQCQQYDCSGIGTQYGEVFDIYTDCVELCNFGDYYDLYGFWFTGYLYPLDGKHLLGTADTMGGWAGCSVELQRRSMTFTFSFIQDGNGYVDTMKCTPCDGCCMLPSDMRLKKSIKEVKGIYNQIGLKMYTWQWTEKAERMFGLKGYSAGVIAQEVKEKYPDAVVEYKGYLTVRYGYLNRLLLMKEG